MNERIDLPTLLALLERYYECSLSDEDEHRLRGIIATTRLRHPAIDAARAVMGFRRARRATKGNFAARWKVYGAVAAGLAMLVAVGITVQGTYRQGDPGLSCIAYANGTTITDEDVILIVIAIATVVAAYAQAGLQINSIFGGKYSADSTVTETMMSGNQRFLKKHYLSTFATFKGPAAKYASVIQPLVLADGAHATGRNIRYSDGKLRYAFFILPSVERNGQTINRYLYYINNEGARKPSVIVIYFEGRIRPEKASELINSMSK